MEGETVIVGSNIVQLGRPLHDDRHGKIYAVQDKKSVAVKIFDDNNRCELTDKTEAMVGSPPNKMVTTQRVTLSMQWPHEIVEHTETDSKIGYMIPMPEISSKKDVLQYATQNLDWSTTSPDERYEIALNLASAVFAIHKQGHAIGNFDHRHILIGENEITVRNCDKFCIRGDDTDKKDGSDVDESSNGVPIREGPYGDSGNSNSGLKEVSNDRFMMNASEESTVYYDGVCDPRYMPTAKHKHTLADIHQNDRFGLAVHIFQLLMQGEHPFQAVGPNAATGSFQDIIKMNPFPYDNPEINLELPDQAPEYQQIHESIRSLFTDAFGQRDSRTAGEYPSSSKWVQTLSATNSFDNPMPEPMKKSAGYEYISGSRQSDSSGKDKNACATEKTDELDYPNNQDTEHEQAGSWINGVTTTSEPANRSIDSGEQLFTLAVEQKYCQQCGKTDLRGHHQGCDAPLIYIGSQWQCGACGIEFPVSGECLDCGASVERKAINVPVDFSPSVSPIDIEHAIHNETNQRRVKHSRNKLEYSEHLSGIAHRHSRNMAHQGFFAHTTPDGYNTSDRYEQFEHDTRQSGENIAIEYPDPTASNNKIAQSIVDAWMKSSGHRENILECGFEAEGIGIYLDPSGAVYATQNFF